MARTKKTDGALDQRKYAPLQTPRGLCAREKGIWKIITADLKPGAISRGNETLLLARLVRAQYRAEYLENELKEVLERSDTSMTVGGNGQLRCHPLYDQIAKTNGEICNLSGKLRLAPVARVATKSAVVNSQSVENPDKQRDEVDLLFMGAEPATAAEKQRWKRERAN